MLCRAPNEPHVCAPLSFAKRYAQPVPALPSTWPSPLRLGTSWGSGAIRGAALVGFLYYADDGDLFLSMLRLFANVTLIAYLGTRCTRMDNVQIKGKAIPRVSLGQWVVLCRRVPHPYHLVHHIPINRKSWRPCQRRHPSQNGQTTLSILMAVMS